MKASNKLSESDQTVINQNDAPLDPFAVDIFGAKSAAIEVVLTDDVTNFKPKQVKKSAWAKNLTRLTNREVNFSYDLQSLPEGLTEKTIEIIRETVARYTFRQPQDVDFSVISVSAVNLNEALGELTKSPKIFFNLATQTDKQVAVVAVNPEFAAPIVDLILGGKGEQLALLRKLSPIEKAIWQFLSLNILREINSFIGSPGLVLQNLSSEFKSDFLPFERGAEIVASLELDEFSGIISLITTTKFLRSLEKSQNTILKSERKGVDYFEKLIPNLEMRLQFGTTSLDAESLLFLEPDDIVLLEKWEIKDGKFSEEMQIYLGKGKNFRLKGRVDEEFNFKIEEIKSEEMRRKFTPAKFKMDEKENELPETETTNEDEISATLENVQVALRVEIAANKISLRELQALHNGQIIALGCRPTDPVRLVTDNNDEPIASGELVEIEGQLGVRLTKVFI